MATAGFGNGESHAIQSASLAVDDLIDALEGRKILLSLEGDKLRLSAPKGAVDTALREELTARRDEIIEAVREREQRKLSRRERDLQPTRIPRNGRLPLSFAQQRLWFLDRLNPGGNAYTIGGASRVSGAIDLDVFAKATGLLAQRHEALTMRFREADGTPFAEIGEGQSLTFEIVDASGTPEDEREAAARRLIAERMREPFDLANGPLLRITAIRFDDDDHVLLNRTHHIVADGWTLAMTSRDCCLAYNALMQGQTPALPPVVAQCADHAAWERRAAERGGWDSELEFWKRELAGAPAITELPGDRLRPAKPSYRGQRIERDIDAELVQRLRKLAATHGVTMYMVLVAALQILIYRHSGQDDVVIGTPVANRDRSEFEQTFGCLINNVVLRGDLSGDPTIAEFLQRVRVATLRAFEHGSLPFDLVVDAVAPDRSVSHTPVFQLLFSYMAFVDLDRSLLGTRSEPMQIDTGATRFDLSVEMIEFRGKIRTLYEYSTDLYDAKTLERTHDRLEALLRALCDDAEQPIGRVPMDAPADLAERSTLPEAPRPAPAKASVPALIDALAHRAPERVAVIAGDTMLDYRALVARANGMAHRLHDAGVRPGDLVAVALDRDADLPAAMLAIWKSGAAYVPLDPAHPAERLALVLDDARPRLVVTLTELASRLPPNWTDATLLLDREEVAPAAAPPAVPVSPTDLAYVIYTSGSTGRPKGVEVEHWNLAAFLDAMRQSPGFAPDDVLVAVTTPSFDIAGLELWLPLTTGGRVVISRPEDARDGRALAALLAKSDATVLQATPATWQLLVESGWTGAPRLKALCGGEAMPGPLPAALLPRVGSLWNLYGPTETTIWSTAARISSPDDPVTIGGPIEGTRVYVLDAADRPAPTGVVGELCIAGAGVARGYRERPELTAEKFVTLDLPGIGRERLYRTGDHARRLRDGRLVFHGRKDAQIKLRGYRIELGDIEAALTRLPGLAEAAAAVVADDTGAPSLVAYVVTRQDAGFDETAARQALRAALPEYMVPMHFVALDALPRTPNLKVDRRALPKPPPRQALSPEQTALMAPTERKVAEIWCDVLGLGAVGLHDNFFDLGGHSLLLLRLHERLRAELGDVIGLVDLFQRTTVAQQATAYAGGSDADAAAAITRARQRAEMLS